MAKKIQVTNESVTDFNAPSMHLGNNANLSGFNVDELKIVSIRYALLVFCFLRGGFSASRLLAFFAAEPQADRYSSCAQGSYRHCNCHVSRKIKITNNAIIFQQAT